MPRALLPYETRRPAVSFALMHRRPLKSTRLAYLLWTVSVFGWLGLHRFYLGKRKTALLWICTAGFFTLGAIADAFLLKWLVARHNRILRLQEWKQELRVVQQKKQEAVAEQKFKEAAHLRDREKLLLDQVKRVKTALQS